MSMNMSMSFNLIYNLTDFYNLLEISTTYLNHNINCFFFKLNMWFQMFITSRCYSLIAS